MLLEKPYFLNNKEWYIENKDLPSFLGGKVKRQYTLTDKAPKKAVDSYNEYYKLLEEKNNLYNINQKPYFMKNKDWYYYDVKTGRYKLTDKAPQKAIDSFNEFYKKIDNQDNITLDAE